MTEDEKITGKVIAKLSDLHMEWPDEYFDFDK